MYFGVFSEVFLYFRVFSEVPRREPRTYVPPRVCSIEHTFTQTSVCFSRPDPNPCSHIPERMFTQTYVQPYTCSFECMFSPNRCSCAILFDRMRVRVYIPAPSDRFPVNGSGNDCRIYTGKKYPLQYTGVKWKGCIYVFLLYDRIDYNLIYARPDRVPGFFTECRYKAHISPYRDIKPGARYILYIKDIKPGMRLYLRRPGSHTGCPRKPPKSAPYTVI